MGPQDYAYQLRTLRAVEKQRQVDLTSNAMTVLELRIQTLSATIEDPDRRAQAIMKAMNQWETFMGRAVPANG